MQPTDVVVITGASSGIGLATAQAFARRGAKLVLAARGAESLEDAAEECRRLGADAIAVPTDVSDEPSVERLAAAAIAEFGCIDVWVGAASVYSYGTFERTPAEVFRKIVETNLLGQVSGARAALPRFREQGSGTLILVGSVYSKVTSPYVSPYIAAKFGLLGFCEVLGQEMRGSGIRVCAVLPSTVDTPIYQHAANYTGQGVHPLPPVVDARRVARAIVRLVVRPRPVTVVGRVQGAMIPLHVLVPRIYAATIGPLLDLFVLRGGTVEATPGSVFEAGRGNRVDGGWSSPGHRILAAVGAVAAMVVLLRKGRRSTT